MVDRNMFSMFNYQYLRKKQMGKHPEYFITTRPGHEKVRQEKVSKNYIHGAEPAKGMSFPLLSTEAIRSQST